MNFVASPSSGRRRDEVGAGAPDPSFPRKGVCQKANFEVRKANPSFPRKRESRGGGGVLQRCFPAPPRLDSRFRGNDDFGGMCLAGMAF